MKKPNVHTGWDPLKEVWLGDVWPAHFYDDLAPEIRDAWYQVTEWTKEDLSKIQKKLEELGVRVSRPYVDGPKELYISHMNDESKGKLVKPPITPRDGCAVVGDKLFFSDHQLMNCYRPLLDEFDQKYIYKPGPTNKVPHLSGANIVKMGRDIVMDRWIPGNRRNDEHLTEYQKKEKLKYFVFKAYDDFVDKEVGMLGNDYRLYMATQGGHCDGAFMPLRNGLLISTQYYNDYEIFFKDWGKIILSQPTYQGLKGNQSRSFWYVPGMDAHPHFNDYIEKNCMDWIGNFKETYFEVNILVIDEKNILCMGYHDALFKEFERRGINCHVVNWRTRSFWDGGLHCITLDTVREGELVDYYPERGEYGLKQIASMYFNYSEEQFYKEYNEWRDTGRKPYISPTPNLTKIETPVEEVKPWLDKLKTIQTRRQ